VDIDPDQYERAFETLRGKPRRRKSTLIIFYQENRVIHAVHSKKGPVEVADFRGPRNLKPLAKEFGVDRVVCLERGALHRFTAGAQAHVKMERPLTEQILACREPFDREWGSGIHAYPDPLAAIPKLPDFALKLLRALLPRKVMAALVVFERDKVWTSLIVEAVNAEVTLITTTDTLQPLKLDGTDINKNSVKILNALANSRGRATVGIFMDRAGFEHIAAHTKPVSALAKLVQLRWAVIRPFPNRLRLLLALAPLLKI
jgi:hypothetical protein